MSSRGEQRERRNPELGRWAAVYEVLDHGGVGSRADVVIDDDDGIYRRRTA